MTEPQRKRCTRCGEVKDFADFSPGQGKDGKHAWCKPCSAVVARERRARNYEFAKARERVQHELYRRTNQERIMAYLAAHSCVDCGEGDPIVLEFDHVRGEKIGSVKEIGNGYSWDRVSAEIQKCEVRCANCHKRRTARHLDYYAYFGRDHEDDYRRAVDALIGQGSLFPEVERERQPLSPLVINLIGAANESLAVVPKIFDEGDQIMIIARFVVEANGVLRVTEAVVDPFVEGALPWQTKS